MAYSAAVSTALIFSNPRSTKSPTPMTSISNLRLAPQTLTIPKSFHGLRKFFHSRVPRSLSFSRASHSRNSFVVRASCKRRKIRQPKGIFYLTTSDATFSIKVADQTKAFAVPRRSVMALILSGYVFSEMNFPNMAFAQQSVGLREYIDTFDGYSFKYPQNWIQVRGAGADIFFRDPYVLDENISVELSSPSSSKYKSVEDLGSPQEAGNKVLKQYLTEFMSTRLGVKRESNVLSTSSRVSEDGRIYYQVEVNIKSFASNNELAVMPQDRVQRLEWNRRYLSVLGVENNRLYELRLQTPENVFLEEENDLRQVMDSFRVNKVAA